MPEIFRPRPLRNGSRGPWLLLTAAACLMTLAVLSPALSAEETPCPNPDSFLAGGQYMPCDARIVSWVAVTIQESDKGIASPYKDDFEKLVRLRLRNDLSILQHEVLPPDEAMKQFSYAFEGEDLRKRVAVNCLIWTVGADWPIAYLQECRMYSYGRHSRLYETVEARTLGYVSKKQFKETADTVLRDLIADLAGQFFDARDVLSKPPSN